ncbi:MAG: hypothetical protein IPJ14_15215 [Kineosporiaceae bacterium]|nr:hypothetical protein [Kineosporiaceae bacterium]
MTQPAVLARTQFETLSHSALSVGHLLGRRNRCAIVFNAANAILLPAIKAA